MRVLIFYGFVLAVCSTMLGCRIGTFHSSDITFAFDNAALCPHNSGGNGEGATPISLGGYKITLVSKPRGAPAQPAAGAPQSGIPNSTPATQLQLSASDTRPLAIVVNTAPDEFLLIGGQWCPEVCGKLAWSIPCSGCKQGRRKV